MPFSFVIGAFESHVVIAEVEIQVRVAIAGPVHAADVQAAYDVGTQADKRGLLLLVPSRISGKTWKRPTHRHNTRAMPSRLALPEM